MRKRELLDKRVTFTLSKNVSVDENLLPFICYDARIIRVKHILILFLFFVGSNALAQERQKELYSTESYEWSDYKKSFRVFPVNLMSAAIHFAYEVRVHNKFSSSFEAQWMPSEVAGNILTGTTAYKVRESYVGFAGQYFFNKYYTGWFIEGGFNFVDVWTISGPMDTVKRGAFYVMPHVGGAYRFPTAIKGLYLDFGAGLVNYWGERIYYVDASGNEQPSRYNGNWDYRLRFDVGLFY